MTGMSDPMPRRRVIQGLAAGAGLMLTGCHPWLGQPGHGHRLRRAGDRPDPGKPEGVDLLPQIEHIVVYMQENHSYDSYFGTFRRGDGYRLRGGEPQDSNRLTTGEPVRVFHAPDTCQSGRGVSQRWENTHLQINGGRMDGFLYNDNTNAMRYWDGSDVPFYWSLAGTFPLCDRWFASAPAQTYPNRMYLQAATSQDLTTTDVGRAFAMPHPAGGTIWEKLDVFGISWLDYAWDLPDIALFPSLWRARLDRVRTFPSFLADCRAGTLPDVSIVSPGVTAYTEENPRDIQLGEAFSASVINAVLASPAWPRTVLVFMYDEHGGYYDHVAPPRAVPPDDIPPDVEPTPDAPAAWDHYGLRVPAFVISPFARRNYVSHVVHDHTSVPRLIETKFNLGALTRRDANASNLLDCLDFRRRPAFLDPPELAAPGLPPTGSVCQPETPPPPTRPAEDAKASPAVAGLGILAGTEAHHAVSGPPLTESQDERLRHLDLLARR
ncbi:MAG TPA: alkaline phosphatase family protein [Acidimicrobiales bacterium]|nr:alkaline phosphatase family protein [Acidimicrobiales bacterium]